MKARDYFELPDEEIVRREEERKRMILQPHVDALCAEVKRWGYKG